jgi:hypothetical protein
MRFELVQRLNAPIDVVEDTLVDPDFIEELGRLPKLGQPQLLEQRDTGETVWQRVRYAFTGNLSSAARAIIDPAKLTWVEESTQDRRTHTTSITIRPDYYGGMFESSGSITLQSEPSDQTTVRTAIGDVIIRMPIVGPRVEAAIISGLREHAELEAETLNRWVASPPDPSPSPTAG